MTKREFISELRRKLSGLPRRKIEERLSFYGEMIDDRIEEGRTEQAAVSDIGSVDRIAAKIIKETAHSGIKRETTVPKRHRVAWKSVLLILGSPIWISLAIAAFAVIFSLYVVMWSLTASIWAVFASLAVCAPGGVIAGIVTALSGNGFAGVLMAGAGILCAGLAIFLFFGCKSATKGAFLLTGKTASGIKNIF